MKRAVCLLVLTITSALAQQPAKDQDLIRFKNGRELSGNITRVIDGSVEVKSKSEGGGVATQQFPIADIERVDFAEAGEVIQKLPSYKPSNAPQLLSVWEARRGLLPLPQSVTGAIGLRVAHLLLETGKPQDAQQAENILKEIIAEDWDEVRRDQANALIIESLRLSGKREEAIKAAEKFLEGEATAHGKAEASYSLAMALAENYRDFIEENPRWEIDPIMRPQRQRLYNQILDLYLSPYLLYEAPPDLTPKSLLAMANFLLEYNEVTAAVAVAEDIVQVFPNSPEVPKAKALIEENS